MSKLSPENNFPRNTFSQEIQSQINTDEELSKIPIKKIKLLDGGVSHYVFELILENNSKLYLKKRADHFAQLPQIKSNPKDIEYEYLALVLFQQIAPENFPVIVTFNKEKNYMLLTDAMPNKDDQRLEDLFLQNQVNSQIITMLGKTLSRIHILTANYQNPIRKPDDREHYQLKLLHRLGYRKHSSLYWAIQELTKLKNKQLILGDPAPKNIGVNNNGKSCTFFDMEEAHLGDPLFDYAYLLGHIIVHNLNNEKKLLEQILNFERSYNNSRFNLRLVRTVALGIVLYRLNSIVPYPLNISINLKKKFESKIENNVLYLDLEFMDWKEIIKIIHT